MTRRPGKPESRLRFTRLELLNWRNFRSAEMDLGLRAFVLGPNAGGKSNLLDAFRFVSELAQPGSGGLQAAVERRGGFTSVRSLFARAPSHVRIAVLIGDDAVAARWRYEVQFNRLGRERSPTVISETITRHGISAPVMVQQRKGGDARDYQQTFLEGRESREFRELQEFLASCRYLHVVPQIVRDRERARREGEDPFGGDLLRRMKEMPEKGRAPRLAGIGEALKLAVPQIESFDLVNDSEGVPHLEARLRNWRKPTAKQQEASFSDGTLRLIGLLWSMSERGGPLLLEEPELSLNDAVISQIPRMLDTMQRLSSRQVIVSTHAGALLEESGVGLAETYIIKVDSDGSKIAAASADQALVAQVEGGLTVGQAVLPLVRPQGVEGLGKIEIAA